MSDVQRRSGGGIGFLGFLTLLFIGLKLTGNIAWSWFWVLSPIIFGWGLLIAVLIIAAIVVVAKG